MTPKSGPSPAPPNRQRTTGLSGPGTGCRAATCRRDRRAASARARFLRIRRRRADHLFPTSPKTSRLPLPFFVALHPLSNTRNADSTRVRPFVWSRARRCRPAAGRWPGIHPWVFAWRCARTAANCACCLVARQSTVDPCSFRWLSAVQGLHENVFVQRSCSGRDGAPGSLGLEQPRRSVRARHC